jgi:hypothetical protein
MSKKYIVSEERLRDLIEAEEKLCALNAGGVDNWSWYGDSIRDYIEQNRFNEPFEEIEELVDRELSFYQKLE